MLTAEEIDEIDDGGEIDIEAVLAAEATERAESTNISYFAFTATPKAKTLELFGREPADGGNPVPFHVYTMKQAIEEGYILDVLTGYHSFKLAFQIGQNRRRRDRSRPVRGHQRGDAVGEAEPADDRQKAAIIVEHFRANVAAPARRARQGDGGHRLPQGRGALQAGDRQVHHQARVTATAPWSRSPGSVQDPESGPE